MTARVERMNDDRVLWEVHPSGEREPIACVMVSCCAGAELRLERGGRIALRELYPDKSTLYERARDLQRAVEAGTARFAGAPGQPDQNRSSAAATHRKAAMADATVKSFQSAGAASSAAGASSNSPPSRPRVTHR